MSSLHAQGAFFVLAGSRRLVSAGIGKSNADFLFNVAFFCLNSLVFFETLLLCVNVCLMVLTRNFELGVNASELEEPKENGLERTATVQRSGSYNANGRCFPRYTAVWTHKLSFPHEMSSSVLRHPSSENENCLDRTCVPCIMT